MDFSIAYNKVDKLNAVERAAKVEDGKINSLNLKLFIAELKNRLTRVISTAMLISFFMSLGNNKSGGNNGVSRCQYFCNAYLEETAILAENLATMRFITDDHEILYRDGHGEDLPDFLFTDGEKTFTIEAKLYWAEESYHGNKKTTNFHKADYVLSYIISTGKWMFSARSEAYQELHLPKEIYKMQPSLALINLPKNFETISFYIPDSDAKLGDLKDYQVPAEVSYTFYNNRAR